MKALKIMIIILLLTLAVGTVSAAEYISDDDISDDNQEILKMVQKDITTDGRSYIVKPLRMISTHQVQIHSPVWLMKWQERYTNQKRRCIFCNN